MHTDNNIAKSDNYLADTDMGIRINHLEFRYESRRNSAVRNVDLVIDKGELIVITGKSGCGKSTLIRCINGLIPGFYEGIYKGSAYVGGIKITEENLSEISTYISSVFQEPTKQFFTTDVFSELVFPCENFGMEKKEIDKRIMYITELLNIHDLIGNNLRELSSGEKQKIAIAASMMVNSNILLMDEPTANMDYHSIIMLTDILNRLKNEGYTIIISEHRIHYLKDLLDKMVYMENGMIREIFKKEELYGCINEKFHLMGLRSLDLFEYNNKSDNDKMPPVDPYSAKPKFLLSIRNLSFQYGYENKIIEDLDLDIRHGEVVALTGKNGAGKTTLAKIICGIKKESKGTISVGQKPVQFSKRAGKINYVMQEVDFQLFGHDVYSSILTGNELIADIESKIIKSAEILNINDIMDEHPTTLSTGQKQRLITASACVGLQDIIIFDEPTSGLDYDSMHNLCKLLDSLTELNKSAIVITHDYEFIANICDRIVLMEDGKITENFYIKENRKKLIDIFKEKL